jgi:hypothetical protein
MLVPDIGQVVGIIDVVPDPLFGKVLNINERFLNETRLRLAGGLPARVNRVNEFKSV